MGMASTSTSAGLSLGPASLPAGLTASQPAVVDYWDKAYKKLEAESRKSIEAVDKLSAKIIKESKEFLARIDSQYDIATRTAVTKLSRSSLDMEKSMAIWYLYRKNDHFWTSSQKSIKVDSHTRAALKELAAQLASARTSPAVSQQKALLQICKEQQRLCKDRETKFKFMGSEHTLEGLWKNVVHVLDEVARLGDPPTSSSTISSLAWLAFKLALKVPVKDAKQRAAVLIGMEKAVVVMNRAALYETDVNNIRQKMPLERCRDIEDNLVSIYCRLLTFLMSIFLLLSGTRWHQVWSSVWSAKDIVDFDKDITDLQVEFDRHAQAFRNVLLQQAFADTNANVQITVERAVVDVFEHLDVIGQNQSLQRSLEALQLNSAIDRTEDSMKTAVSAAVKTIQDGIGKMEEKRQAEISSHSSQSRLEVLSWLSEAPYLTEHRNAKRQRVSSTGQWIFSKFEYIFWTIASDPQILLIQGDPGTGKTTLMTSLVDKQRRNGMCSTLFTAEGSHLELSSDDDLESLNSSIQTAFFYCRKGDPARSTCRWVVGSLIRQLAEQHKKLPAELVKMFERKGTTGARSSELGHRQYMELLQCLMPPEKETFLFLDALDECGESSNSSVDRRYRQEPDQEIRDILTIFSELLKSNHRVKIVLSSRPNIILDEFFREKALKLAVTKYDNTVDILKMVRARIEDKNHDRLAVGRKPLITEELKKEIINVFEKKSDGMFQWAQYHIADLLSLHSSDDIRDALNGLPRDLKDTYDETFKRITYAETSTKKKIASQVIQWLLASGGSCSAKLVLAALSLNKQRGSYRDLKYDERDVVQVCFNLVAVEGEVFRFAHLSIQEYCDEYQFSPGDYHGYVTEMCLDMMLHYQGPYFKNDIKSERLQEQASFVDLWDYSCDFWLAHFEHASKQRQADLKHDAVTVLGGEIPSIACAHWALHRADETINASGVYDLPLFALSYLEGPKIWGHRYVNSNRVAFEYKIFPKDLDLETGDYKSAYRQYRVRQAQSVAIGAASDVLTCQQALLRALTAKYILEARPLFIWYLQNGVWPENPVREVMGMIVKIGNYDADTPATGMGVTSFPRLYVLDDEAEVEAHMTNDVNTYTCLFIHAIKPYNSNKEGGKDGNNRKYESEEGEKNKDAKSLRSAVPASCFSRIRDVWLLLTHFTVHGRPDECCNPPHLSSWLLAERLNRTFYPLRDASLEELCFKMLEKLAPESQWKASKDFIAECTNELIQLGLLLMATRPGYWADKTFSELDAQPRMLPTSSPIGPFVAKVASVLGGQYKHLPVFIDKAALSGPMFLSPFEHPAEFYGTLLKHGADVNSISTSAVSAKTALLGAASNDANAVVGGSEDAVNVLLAHGADVNSDGDGDPMGTALIASCIKGYTKVAKALLANEHIDVNAIVGQDCLYETALIAACASGYPDIVEELLRFESLDINFTSDMPTAKYFSALGAACVSNHVEVVEMLLRDKRTNVNLVSKDDQETALMQACKAGCDNVVEVLLECKNIDVNATSPICHSVKTAFSMAMESPNWKPAQLLLADSRLDVNQVATTPSGLQTALMAVCSRHRFRDVQALLRRPDTDVNMVVPSNICGTALITACCHALREESGIRVVDELLSCERIDVNLVSTAGGFRTALDAACYVHNTGVTKKLFKRGANVFTFPGPTDRAADREKGEKGVRRGGSYDKLGTLHLALTTRDVALVQLVLRRMTSDEIRRSLDTHEERCDILESKAAPVIKGMLLYYIGGRSDLDVSLDAVEQVQHLVDRADEEGSKWYYNEVESLLTQLGHEQPDMPMIVGLANVLRHCAEHLTDWEIMCPMWAHYLDLVADYLDLDEAVRVSMASKLEVNGMYNLGASQGDGVDKFAAVGLYDESDDENFGDFGYDDDADHESDDGCDK